MTDIHAITQNPTGAGLATLLRQQHALYQRLREMSDRQRHALEHGSTQELLTVLGQRQGVVDELTEVAGGLSAVGGRWSDLVAELDDDERGELQRVTREVQRLAEEVMRRDEDDQSELRGMRQRKGEELGAMHHNQAAAAAYRGGSAYRPPSKGGTAAAYPSAHPQTPRFADRSA